MKSESRRNIALIIIGFSAGIAGASLGIGGGVLVVPALSLWLRINFKKAVATSLATIIPAALIGAVTYALWDVKTGQQNIVITAALTASIGSIIGTFIGTRLLHITHDKILKFIFAMLLLFISLKLFGIINIQTAKIENAPWLGLIIAGAIAGLLSGMLGIGGGVILVPALTLFFVDSIHQAIPTSLCIIVPTTVAGTFFHKKLDNLDTSAIKLLIPFAITGAILGVFIKNSLPEGKLRAIFAVFLIVSSVKTFITICKKDS